MKTQLAKTQSKTNFTSYSTLHRHSVVPWDLKCKNIHSQSDQGFWLHRRSGNWRGCPQETRNWLVLSFHNRGREMQHSQGTPFKCSRRSSIACGAIRSFACTGNHHIRRSDTHTTPIRTSRTAPGDCRFPVRTEIWQDEGSWGQW